MRNKLTIRLIAVVLALLALPSCDRDGRDFTSNWDEMIWDQDNWQ
jgi:hypothetical protein